MLSNILKRVRVVEDQKPKKKPSMACDKDSTFVYQSGADVQKTWRKYGWTAPSEYRNDYEFAKNREMKK